MKQNKKSYSRHFGYPVLAVALVSLAACAPQVQMLNNGSRARIETVKVDDLERATVSFARGTALCLRTADPDLALYRLAGASRSIFGNYIIRFRNIAATKADENEVTVSLAPRFGSGGTLAGTTIEIDPANTEFGSKLATFAQGFPDKFDCSVFDHNSLAFQLRQPSSPITIPIYKNVGGVYKPTRYVPVM